MLDFNLTVFSWWGEVYGVCECTKLGMGYPGVIAVCEYTKHGVGYPGVIVVCASVPSMAWAILG